MVYPEYEEIKKRHTGNGRDQGWREIELIDFADMHARLDTRPLIKGILEHEQISVTIGDPGSGKTFLNLDRDLHIALGRDWFEHPVQQGGVVYIAAEAGVSIFNRVVAFRQHHGTSENVPFKAIITAIDLCHPDGDLNRLIDLIGTAQFSVPLALVEIDTISRAMFGGDENSSADMGALLRSLDALRDQLHCHVSAIHHFGKDSGRGPRGHSLLKAGVDTVVEIERNETTRVSSLKVVKQRDGEAGTHFAFRLHPVELGYDRAGDPVTSCIVMSADKTDAQKPLRLSPAQSRALDLLRDAINRHGEMPPANNYIPAGKLCVKEDLWRRFCNEGSIAKSDKPDAKRVAFTRAAEHMIAMNIVGKWGDVIWIV
jgi:hypothetical protein